MVAIGVPGIEFDAELIEATAELVPITTRQLLPEPFARKYADCIAHAGITLDCYAAVYSQQIRIRPTRWLSWGGQSWRDVDGGASGPPGELDRTGVSFPPGNATTEQTLPSSDIAFGRRVSRSM